MHAQSGRLSGPALGFASDLMVGASNKDAGSVVSQFWNLAGKSMLRTWPMTDVILKCAGRPLKDPLHS